MKNPDDMRLVIAAVTLWILRGVYPERSRRAQNDSSHFDRSICKSALKTCEFAQVIATADRTFQRIGVR